MTQKILVINTSLVEELLPMSRALDVTEGAFIDYANKESFMPAKVYLDLPEYKGDFRAMPAYSKQYHMAGIKWVNSHSSNREKGLPSVMAFMLLNDPETGVPLAMVEATTLTALRTGAAGGVAVKYLATPEASSLSLVGCGQQAYYQFLAIKELRQLTDVTLVDNNIESAKRLADRIQAMVSCEVHVMSSIKEAISSADIIVTTTPSQSPLIMSEWVAEGVHINAVGADAPGKQELDPGLLQKARIVVDDIEQATHSGELNVPVTQKVVSLTDIEGQLGDVIIEKTQGRHSSKDITVFDSTGLAIQDIAVAGYIYHECVKKNLGKYISI